MLRDLSTWLRTTLKNAKAAKHARPSLEFLEDRSVPATFTVINTNDSGAGSLRDAIATANSTAGADTVDFAAGLSGSTITLTSGKILVTDSLSLQGLGANNLTISGGGTSQILDAASFADSLLSVSGLRFTNAQTGNAGGAIETGLVVSLAISDCIFDNNRSSDGAVAVLGNDTVTVTVTNSQFNGNTGQNNGGGMYAGGKSVTISGSSFVSNTATNGVGGGLDLSGTAMVVSISNSVFSNNTANTDGGGIFLTSQASTTITDSVFNNNRTLKGAGGGLRVVGNQNAVFKGNTVTNNQALEGAGGGAQIVVSNLSIIDSSFEGNYALKQAGGIEVGNTVSFINSTFAGNTSAERGGGIAFGLITKATMINSTVVGNTVTSASGTGGGINAFDTFNIYNSTITGNSSANDGGGIKSNFGMKLTIQSSVIAENSAANVDTKSPDITGEFTTIGNNIFGKTGTLDSAILATDTRVASTGFGNLQNNGGPTKTRLPAGAAIGNGVNPLNLTTDQRGTGFARARGGGVDIGAVTLTATEAANLGVTTGVNNGTGAGVVGGIFPIATDDTANSVDGFLNAIYREILGRDVDPHGRKTFGDRLDHGEARWKIASEIWQSTEHRGLQIDGYYQALFGRSASGREKDFWYDFFQNKGTAEEMLAKLAGSSEFSGTTGDTNAFLDKFYSVFLKRTVDLESRNQYLQLLADKSITKESLVKGILASPEFHGLYIDAAYSDYLGRAAEPGTGKDASLTSFAGGMTIDQFNIGMLASDEYFGLHGSKNYA